MSSTLLPDEKTRFVFIDALRGVAATVVMIYHMMMSPWNSLLVKAISGPVAQIINYGYLGVWIFFTISGFVIAHSLRQVVMTRAAVLNFILRRQIRLDFTYWTAIALTIALAWACHRAVPRDYPRPTIGVWQVLLNMFYLHRIFGEHSIVGVSWTLCLEIQFYLAFILLLYVGAPGRAAGAPSARALALLSTSGAATLLCDPSLDSGFEGVWLFRQWRFFVAGVLCYWALTGAARTSIFIGFIVLMAASCALHPTNALSYAGLLTTIVVFGVGKLDRLKTWSGGPVLQYLGRISYSLYLVHWLVRGVVQEVGYHFLRRNEAMALLTVACAIGVSILAAHMLYVLVERPTQRLASSLKRRTSPPVLESQGVELSPAV